MENSYKKYDTYVSLGYNCEVSFRIQDFWGRLESYPLSWAYILNRNYLIEALNHLDKILTGDINVTPWHMVIDEDYKISLHLKLYTDKLFLDDGTLDIFYASKSIFELKSRFSHLVNKFLDLLKSEKRTLFIIKVLPTEVHEQWLIDLYNWLNIHYISGKWNLLIVLEERSEEPNGEFWSQAEKALIAKVPFFAPDSDTKLGGCPKEWGKILRNA